MEKSKRKIDRLIDANFNRVREGLRVVEDIARFILDDKKIVNELKNMRSDISLIQKQFSDTLHCRDTAGDVGTSLNSSIEKERSDIKDIIFANMKRVEESLRVLEEAFKLVDNQSSLKFKELRYKAYILEEEIIEAREQTSKFV